MRSEEGWIEARDWVYGVALGGHFGPVNFSVTLACIYLYLFRYNPVVFSTYA